MKTRNDILAEYVRSRYPEIEKTFDLPPTLLVWLSKSSADVSKKRSEALIRR